MFRFLQDRELAFGSPQHKGELIFVQTIHRIKKPQHNQFKENMMVQPIQENFVPKRPPQPKPNPPKK
ncbi:hypothetical protein PA42_14380 [Pasteurella canis]|uniref:Uncharacterized protein n=1 Tax=Pasteurella canis TaxID=753 RepID=A0ABQ4VIR4_9PAST|nr:hypothetical protein PA42_14380 [Pasteurella canis]